MVIKKPLKGRVFDHFKFLELIDKEKRYSEGKGEEDLVKDLRKISDDWLLTTEQVVRVLGFLTKPNLRVETFVIAFARTMDWHQLKHVFEYLHPAEIDRLRERIGLANMFDECMAVGFYELNLKDIEQR